MDSETTNILIEQSKFLSSVHIIPRKHTNLELFADLERNYEDKFSDIPKPSIEENYWRNLFLKRGFYDFTKDEAKAIIDSRLDFFVDYYGRLFRNKLTDEELNKPKPNNYIGPYLPTMEEIEKLKHLDIMIDYQVPENYFSRSKPDIFIKQQHCEQILKRWEEFKREYRMYDLRPLIGSRCGVVLKNAKQEFDFTWYRLINYQQYKNFVIYMSKPVPGLKYNQMTKYLSTFCDQYSDGKFMFEYGCINYASGLEYRLIYEICDRFGTNRQISDIMSLLIGKRNAIRYLGLVVACRTRRVPFHDKKWTKDEDIALMKLIKEESRETDWKSILCSKKKFNWNKISMKLKLRKREIYRARFDTLKQKLIDEIYKKTKNVDDSKFTWTPDLTVKLIELIYESNFSSYNMINWYSMAKHFPGYCPRYISTILQNLIHARVPRSLRHRFEDLIEYLYDKVKPIYKLKDIRHRRRKCDLELLASIESSTITKEERNRRFNNFFNIDSDDDDEDIFLIERPCNQATNDDQHNSFLVENSDEEVPFWEEEPDENELKQLNQKNSKKYFDVAYDDLFWQKIMKMANFDPKYSTELKKKLRFHLPSEIIDDLGSEISAHISCSSAANSYIADSRRKANIYRDTSNYQPDRDIEVHFEISDSSFQNQEKILFGRKRKRLSTNNVRKGYSDNSASCPKGSFTRPFRSSGNIIDNENINNSEVIILSSDEDSSYSVKSKSKRRRLEKEPDTLRRNSPDLENHAHASTKNFLSNLISKTENENTIRKEQCSKEMFSNSIKTYNCDGEVDNLSNFHQKKNYSTTDKVNRNKACLDLELIETEQIPDQNIDKILASNYSSHNEDYKHSPLLKKKKKKKDKEKNISTANELNRNEGNFEDLDMIEINQSPNKSFTIDGRTHEIFRTYKKKKKKKEKRENNKAKELNGNEDIFFYLDLMETEQNPEKKKRKKSENSSLTDDLTLKKN